jgi:hypothetical protein
MQKGVEQGRRAETSRNNVARRRMNDDHGYRVTYLRDVFA